MSIVVTPIGAASIAAGGSSTTNTFSGVTLGTGDIYLFAFIDSADLLTGVVIGGVTASPIGTSGGGSIGQGSGWKAVGVSTPTGNIVVTSNNNIQILGVNWFLVTGEDNTSAVYTATSAEGFNMTDPASVVGNISTGGVGLVAVASTITSGTRNPVTWTNCVSPGNTTLETFVATGNQLSMGGNYTIATGATVTVTGSGTASFSGSCGEIMMISLAQSSGGGGSNTPSFGGFNDPIVLNIRSVAY